MSYLVLPSLVMSYLVLPSPVIPSPVLPLPVTLRLPACPPGVAAL